MSTISSAGGRVPPLIVEPERAVHSVTLVVDTLVYAAGDLMSNPVEIPDFFTAAGQVRKITSIQGIDEADQVNVFDLVFTTASTTFGTLNVAPTLADVDARNIVGHVAILAADTTDIGGSKIITKGNLNLLVQGGTSRSLYVAAISRGTMTYTAADVVKLRIGVE